MKKVAFLVAMSIGMMASAQEKKEECKCPHYHFDKEKFEKLKSLKEFGNGDPHKFLEEAKIKRILEELKIPEKDREETRKLFEQYFQQKNELVKSFKKDKKKLEELTNEEALQKINTSFEMAQKMLDFRKEYAEIFLKKFTPQEVIKIHQIEKKMFDFVIKKHQEKKEK